ncbi:MAG: hypothetical protein B6I20_12175, partial [Bacteroidetes bacterium 4572_117]
ASSAEELAAQADLLKETISFFDIGGNAKSNTSSFKRKKTYKKVVKNNDKIESADKGVNLNLSGMETDSGDFERY